MRRQGNCEYGSTIRRTYHSDLAPHERDHLLSKGKAQTGTTFLAANATVDLNKGAENALELVSLDAYSRIGDGDYD